MTTYNTGNPVGSADPRDLFDNAEILDHWINDRTVDHWNDRLGVERWTWRGIENRFDSAMQDWDQRFSLALASVGYIPAGAYDDGPITLTEYNQIILKDGSWWKPSASLSLPYTTVENWGVDVSNFISIGDGTLRDDLAATGGVELVGNALDSRKNLSDLEDPAAARSNMGILRANQAQSEAGTSDELFATPLGVAQRILAQRASQAQAVTGENNETLMTPLRVAQAIASSEASDRGAHFAVRTDSRTSNQITVAATYTVQTSVSTTVVITPTETAPPIKQGHMVVLASVSASSGTPPSNGLFWVDAVDSGTGSFSVGVSFASASGSGTCNLVFLQRTGSTNDYGVDSIVRAATGVIIVNPATVLQQGFFRYNHGHVSGSARSASAVLTLTSTVDASGLTAPNAVGGNYTRFVSLLAGNGSPTDAADATIIGYKA